MREIKTRKIHKIKFKQQRVNKKYEYVAVNRHFADTDAMNTEKIN